MDRETTRSGQIATSARTSRSEMPFTLMKPSAPREARRLSGGGSTARGEALRWQRCHTTELGVLTGSPGTSAYLAIPVTPWLRLLRMANDHRSPLGRTATRGARPRMTRS